MVIFALVISLIILSLLIPKIGMPSMENYGDKQAYINAKILASSINSLSSMEQGVVVKTLDLEWDLQGESPLLRAGEETAVLLVDALRRGNITVKVSPMGGLTQ